METPRRARRRWRAGLLTPGRLAGDGIMGLSSPVANEVIATLRPRLVSAALRLQPWVRGMLTRRRLLRPASLLGQWALLERCSASTGLAQRKVCYLYRLACAGSIDETILMRQGGKDSLLKVLTSGKLPPAKSDDRALLFALDVSGTRLGGEGAGVAALAAAAIDVESVRTLDLADAAGVESVPSLECPALEGLCRVALREPPGLPTTTTDGLAAAARDGDGEDAGVRATTQTPPLLVECVVHGVLKSK